MSSTRRDYVPRHDADYNNWFSNIIQYVAAMTGGTPPQWDNIPQSSILELNGAFTDWELHYLPTLQPHTPAHTTAKRDARVRSERVVREFVQRFLRWPPITNSDRTNMKIPNRDTIRTPQIEVPEVVEFKIKLRDIREVIVEFKVKGAANRAKPRGYDGALIAWDVLDTPPVNPQSLTKYITASRTPMSLDFDETERGKTVYVAAKWLNGRGLAGKWSDIKSTVIP